MHRLHAWWDMWHGAMRGEWSHEGGMAGHGAMRGGMARHGAMRGEWQGMEP